jgi:predicted nuclease with RNAse H fold
LPRTWGVDVAVDPKKTALCSLTWSTTGAAVTLLDTADDNELISHLQHHDDVIGIDAPLGWPRDFAETVATYMGSPARLWPTGHGQFDDSVYHRLRRTDKYVVEVGADRGIPIRPLSVSADKLGATAMKAAWLSAQLGKEIDRSGLTGRFVEVYPAAAVLMWGLDFGKYKSLKKADEREAVQRCARQLKEALGFPMEGLDGLDNEHQLDALICALVARAARCGMTLPPPPMHTEAAQYEGWIHLPDRPLTDLLVTGR